MEAVSRQARISFLCVPVWREYLKTMILEYLRRKRQVNTGYGEEKNNKSGEAAWHQKHATHPYHLLVHLPPSVRRP
jgi:hypothetical protein